MMRNRGFRAAWPRCSDQALRTDFHADCSAQGRGNRAGAKLRVPVIGAATKTGDAWQGARRCWRVGILLNALMLLSEYSPEQLTRLALTVLGPFEDVSYLCFQGGEYVNRIIISGASQILSELKVQRIPLSVV